MNTVALFLLFVVVKAHWLLPSVPPPKPSLTCNHRVFVRGEYIRFTCRAGDRNGVHRFNLYKGKENHPIQSREVHKSETTSFFTNRYIVWDESADFSCDYVEKTWRGEVNSYRSDSIKIVVIERPPRPSLLSDHKVFVRGESATFFCQVASVDGARIFNFYKGSQSNPIKNTNVTAGKTVVSFTNTEIVWDRSATYSCDYTVKISDRYIISDRSNSVTITIQERTPKPSLSCNHEVFVRGESATFTCRAGYRYGGRRFNLYEGNQTRPVKTEVAMAGKIEVNFSISDIVWNGPATYTCGYVWKISEREIISERSDSVTITMLDPPRPRISVDSSVTIHDANVTFTCTSEWEITGMTFHLYGPGGLNDSVYQPPTALKNSVTFTIRNVDADKSGNYTCGSEAVVKGRQLKSMRSESVHLSVRDVSGFAKSFLTWIPAVAALSLILIIALLGISCWRKKRSRRHGGMGATHSPSEDRDEGNVVYADLVLKPKPKRRKQESSQIYDDDRIVYAAVKI